MMRATNRPTSKLLLTLAAFGLTTSGCDALFGTYCDENSDCPAEQVCDEQLICVDGERPSDFEPDAGVEPDALVDGGDEQDAGLPEIDAGLADAGLAGLADAGLADAGLADAGLADAGLADAGGSIDDAGLVDGGVFIVLNTVNGSGSELPVGAVPTLDGGVIAATRRLQDTLVVTGENLNVVDRASIASDSPEPSVDLEIVGEPTNGEIIMRLPPSLAPGLMTLTLSSTTFAASASAQVFVVQGEPATPIVTQVVAANASECPTGGTVLTIGPDTDNDGSPNSGTPVVLCNGAQGQPGDPSELSCTTGNCTISGNLNVLGDFAVDGSPVQKVVNSDETRNVSSLSQLEAELVSLQEYRIAPGATVTLQIASGGYAVTTPISVHHPDASRIRLVGNTTNPASVGFVCADICILASGGHHQGLVDGIFFRAETTGSGSAFVIRENSHLELGGNVLIEDFENGILVENGGFVNSTGGVEINDCEYAVRAKGGSVAILPELFGTGLQNGVWAQGSYIEVSQANLTGIGVGLALLGGENGTLITESCAIGGFGRGAHSEENGYLDVDACDFSNNSIGVSGFRSGVIRMIGVSVQNGDTGVELRNASIALGNSLSLTGNTTDLSVSSNSEFIQ